MLVKGATELNVLTIEVSPHAHMRRSVIIVSTDGIAPST